MPFEFLNINSIHPMYSTPPPFPISLIINQPTMPNIVWLPINPLCPRISDSQTCSIIFCDPVTCDDLILSQKRLTSFFRR